MNRTFIAVAILAVSSAAATSAPVRAQAQEAQPATSPQADEVSRQRLVTSTLAPLLMQAGVEVVDGLRAQEAATFRQVQVHWEISGGANPAVNAAPASGTLTAGQSAPGVGKLPHRRALELAETEVLVVALDDHSRLLWWDVLTDPRLLRAETVTASGSLSGGITYLPHVDFPISYPDDPAIVELRVFHPEWTGAGFHLTSLASLSVR